MATTIKTRITIAAAATCLAVASATGGALVSGGSPATAAGTAKQHCAKGGERGAGMQELRKAIRAGLKDARGGSKDPLTPAAVTGVVAPIVRKAVQDGTVKQAAVDRRAARLSAMAKAFGG